MEQNSDLWMGIRRAEGDDEDLLETLGRNGALDLEGAERARRAQARTHGSMVAILSRLGLCSEKDVAAAVAQVTGLRLVSAEEFPAKPVNAAGANMRFLRESKLLPISSGESGFVIAVADPWDLASIRALELALGRTVDCVIAAASDIEEAILRFYEEELSPAPSRLASAESIVGSGDADVDRLRAAASEAPVIRLVDRLIARAVEARASDVHLEMFERNMRVRIRIDGVLRVEDEIPASVAPAIISRIKILARLDIAERRLPQDGSIKLNVRGREIDLRVASAPAAYGETLVIRILDGRAVELDLAALGFEIGLAEKLHDFLQRPNGIFLVTGPTGSGKSTTLYAGLKRLNTVERKIITIEDPVEYKIAGLNQIQVKPDIGLNFARTLRSALRHDPDMLMVGEIRDAETARIAVQAALTGHLVISTLHTNDAPSAVTRLLDMGIEEYLVASTVIGVLAQRLVRRLCSECSVPAERPDTIPRAVWQSLQSECDGAFRAPVGCAACAGIGYRERIAIAELMPFDANIRDAVIRRTDASKLKDIALKGGMETLLANGMRRAAEGITTASEVLRVAQNTI